MKKCITVFLASVACSAYAGIAAPETHNPIDTFINTCANDQISPADISARASNLGWSVLDDSLLQELLWGILGADRKGWSLKSLDGDSYYLIAQISGQITGDIRSTHRNGELAVALPISKSRSLSEPVLNLYREHLIGSFECTVYFIREDLSETWDEVSRVSIGGVNLGEPFAKSDRKGKGRDSAKRPGSTSYYLNGLIKVTATQQEGGEFLIEMGTTRGIEVTDDIERFSLR